MLGLLFGASNMYQRTIVQAHDRDWIVCLVLDQGRDEPADADRFALAVPCDKEGRVELPSTPQLIRFTPQWVVEQRDNQARCAAAGHVLRDKWSMWGGKMKRSCDCLDKHEEREPTVDERKYERLR